MVLKVKDHIWSQNEDFVIISIPIKGKRKQDVDIICTDSYIKVNFCPYMFECFTWARIDENKSKTIFGEGLVELQLCKLDAESWPTLHAEFSDDREECDRHRRAALQKHEEAVKAASTEKAEQKREGSQFSLRQMMDLESKAKQRLKNTKEAETQRAMQELEQWKQQHRQGVKPSLTITEILDAPPQETVVKAVQPQNQIFEEKEEEEEFPMRRPCKIDVVFTPRVFPTPERESVKEKEEEWLRQQRDIRQKAVVRVTADMKENEVDPDWLRNKGNSLFAAGDFSAAVEAFSMALHVNPHLYESYSNRAACHIKMRNFFKATEDATKAIELLTPPVPQNAAARVRAHLRRGAALIQLRMFREGLLDLELAQNLDPENMSIKADIDRVRTLQ